ncbi:MAG: diaminopimelate decarboxylase [Spirochaetes bacterium]|nr:diaminopimelate decarboxylase [Spirochaetota bacterium]
MFSYRDGQLYCEDTALAGLTKDYPTPFYVYSRKVIKERIATLKDLFAPVDAVLAYAVKVNNNLSILNVIAGEGLGADIISRGELYRYLKAGGDPKKVVFSGVAKTEEELRYAIERGIRLINTESIPEIAAINSIAADYGRKVDIAIRINPDVAADTHHKITTGKKGNKFGVSFETVKKNAAMIRGLTNVRLTGIAMHLGSQIMKAKPYYDAIMKAKDVLTWLKGEGFAVTSLDIGGGIGVPYKKGDAPFDFETYKRDVIPLLASLGVTIIVEPGRYLVAESAALIMKVIYIKEEGEKIFVAVDAGMNDFQRVALYDAHHEVLPLVDSKKTFSADVVGPICESSDYFTKDRVMPVVAAGDYIALMGTGGYGYSMSSNYNGREHIAEIMVDGAKSRVIRRAQTLEEMVTQEIEYLNA